MICGKKPIDRISFFLSSFHNRLTSLLSRPSIVFSIDLFYDYSNEQKMRMNACLERVCHLFDCNQFFAIEIVLRFENALISCFDVDKVNK